MKRLIFCFDGTWNALNANTPTNVVLTAASIFRTAPDGTAQVIHYDEGVGTGRLERNTGGMFGAGLVVNIREAYRFLIFNYDPGDEIFVFGFSRGAWSARTFVGFIRHVGPLRRLHAARIDEALNLYRHRLDGEEGASEALLRFRANYSNGVCVAVEDDEWRCLNVEGYAAGNAPPLTIKYLGVWDTVSALGIPKVLPLSRLLNKKHRFHDAVLTSFVESARHAVAIDEGRALFPAEPWGDLTALNAAKGFEASDTDAPYQERWFPGTHGSVGGGGDIRGLSDGTLAWVLKGAKDAGLRLDIEKGSRIQAFKPDPLAPLVNEKSPSGGPTQWLKMVRDGPTQPWQVSAPAIRRWHARADALPEQKLYRPSALSSVAAALQVLPVSSPISEAATTHKVVERDTLSKIAKLHLGNSTLAATLAYDPGMRLHELVGTTTQRFQYDGLDLIAEYDGANAITKRYVHGPGMDEPLVEYDGAGTSTKRWLHADERGSIIASSDSGGNLVTINRYDEYGKPQATNAGRFQYTGQTWLPEVGAYYYKARMYQPTLGGRFLQPDPIGYNGGINLYAYVANDSINLTDPLGLEVVVVTGRRCPDGTSFVNSVAGVLYCEYDGVYPGRESPDQPRLGDRGPNRPDRPERPEERIERLKKQDAQRRANNAFCAQLRIDAAVGTATFGLAGTVAVAAIDKVSVIKTLGTRGNIFVTGAFTLYSFFTATNGQPRCK